MRSRYVQAALEAELERQKARLANLQLGFNPRQDISPGNWMSVDILRHDMRLAFVRVLGPYENAPPEHINTALQLPQRRTVRILTPEEEQRIIEELGF